jgi:putative spermidine/putrescine transport system substrate-binding protein
VLETIKRNEPASAPDVIDVGLSFGAAAKREGLLQPHKVSAWDSIPDTVKDPEGFWYGAYGSVLAFEVNVERVKNVPLDWPDLLASEYRNSVALAGNPLVSDQAIRTVYAAGLSAGGGSRDRAAGEGLRFFAELHRRGNLVPRLGDSELLARGVTPILIRWHHLALGDRDRFAGNPKIEVVLPKTGLVGGVYVQAISASAPHPNAAKLWMEYLYSDEAQLAFLSSYSHPIRFDDLVSKGKVPARLLERQPEIRGNQASDAPVFPTVEEQEKAKEIIKNGWDDIIGVEIKCPENVPPARSPTSLNDTLRHSSLAS